MPQKACRACKIVTEDSVCPECKGSDLSEDFQGFAIILDAKRSQIAEKMGIDKEGQYALKIR